MGLKHLYTFVAPHRVFARRLGLLLICLLFPLLSVPARASQNTTFLPLKINSTSNTAELAKSADTGLNAALQAANLSMVPRGKAEKMINYTTWPPTAKDLSHIARQTGMNNIAVGTLTVLGNQISIDYKVFDALAPATPTFFTRQVKSTAGLADALAGLVHDILATTQKAFTVASITFQGNRHIESGAIMRRIKTRVGDIYNPTVLREDLRSIFKMGYFDDVQLEVNTSPQGKDIIFKIVEKPIIESITYTGTEAVKEKDVKDAANLRAQTILNPVKINDAVDNIKKLYRSKGYFNTKVDAKITYPTHGIAQLKFAITEGNKVYIEGINFHGNKTFSNSELADVMKTGTRRWYSWFTDSGILDMDELHQDSGRIVSFYNNHGFLDAKISDPIITQKNGGLYITFDVDEGRRYGVGTIDFRGDLITSKQHLINLMTIRKQRYLDRQMLRDDILKIQDLYAEKGYAFVEIRPDLKKSASGKRFDIVLNIHKGDLVHINRIIIKGNTRTRDNVIRRELKFAEGGIFNSKAIRESSENLHRLNFFEQVNISPQPTANPDEMNIDVDVQEKSTGKFSVGVGYSSVDQVVLMGQISENNFLGLGDRLAFMANTGAVNREFDLSFTNPHVNDSPLYMGIDLFDVSSVLTDYTSNSKGGTLRLGYPLWGKWMGIGSYSFTDTHLSDVTANAAYVIRASEDIHTESAVKLTLKRDARNQIYAPSKGSYNEISIQYAGGPFGGQAKFTKVQVMSSWYFPFLLGTTFHVRGSAGEAWSNSSNGLPVYERFYLGGINTVRGFKYAKISPRDPATGDLIGGNKMWYTNTEILFPISAKQGIQGVIFYDMGNVLDDNQNWSFSGFKKSTGVGVNWMSPLGPLRIDWGINLSPTTGEARSVWDFTIGGMF